MNLRPIFFADFDPHAFVDAIQRYVNSPRLNEVLIVAGALAAAILVAFVGAYIYFKMSKRRRRQRRHHRPETSVQASAKVEQRDSSEERRNRKRRRRPQRPMNPTLAQTGGLPPIRD